MTTAHMEYIMTTPALTRGSGSYASCYSTRSYLILSKENHHINQFDSNEIPAVDNVTAFTPI